jgi:hypothetical protein
MGHSIKGVTGSKPRVNIAQMLRAEAAAAKKRKKGKRRGSR